MIRRAVAEDADGIAHVHNASRAEAYAHLGEVGHVDASVWRAFLEQELPVWVWEQDDAILGFASVAHGELTTLYVLPGAQGKRIGTGLLDFAVEHGARELWIYEDNPRGRKFYERERWVVVPESVETSEDVGPPFAPAIKYSYPAPA